MHSAWFNRCVIAYSHHHCAIKNSFPVLTEQHLNLLFGRPQPECTVVCARTCILCHFQDAQVSWWHMFAYTCRDTGTSWELEWITEDSRGVLALAFLACCTCALTAGTMTLVGRSSEPKTAFHQKAQKRRKSSVSYFKIKKMPSTKGKGSSSKQAEETEALDPQNSLPASPLEALNLSGETMFPDSVSL